MHFFEAKIKTLQDKYNVTINKQINKSFYANE